MAKKQNTPAQQTQLLESPTLEAAVENFLVTGCEQMEEAELVRCLDAMTMFAKAAPDKFKKVFSKEFIQKASDVKGLNIWAITDLVNLVMS
ncbi:MAG: hypothetical protein U0X91_30750 [Spirosomataceae bacterium]